MSKYIFNIVLISAIFMSGCPNSGARCNATGACDSSGQCKGGSGTCTTPPDAVCIDKKSVRTYQQNGVATTSGRAYVSSDAQCPSSSCGTSEAISRVRLDLSNDKLEGWKEFDAVGIVP